MHKDNSTPYHDFKSAFEEYYNPLCNYANSFLKNPEASEDIVQEIFISIWEKRQDLISSDTLRFYLFTAIRNNCLSYLKKQNKSIIEPLNELQVAEVNDDTQVSEEYYKAKYKMALAASIDQLPPKCKEVFVLSRMSELSYKEIAEMQGISIKTVENQIGKALKLIRAFVKDHRLVVVIIFILNYFL